jgi:hypothetical protein
LINVLGKFQRIMDRVLVGFGQVLYWWHQCF